MQTINFEYNHLIVSSEDLDVICKYINEPIDDLNSEIKLEELGINPNSLKEALRDHLEEFYGERNEHVEKENNKIIPMIEEAFADAKVECYGITEEKGLHQTIVKVKAPSKVDGVLVRKIENQLKIREEDLNAVIEPASHEALSAKALSKAFKSLIEDEELLSKVSERLAWW